LHLLLFFSLSERDDLSFVASVATRYFCSESNPVSYTSLYDVRFVWFSALVASKHLEVSLIL